MKQILSRNKKLLFVTIALSLCANFALVLTSKQYEWLFDALETGDIDRFFWVVGTAIAYIFFIAFLFYVYLVCSKKLIRRILFELREAIFVGVMKQDMKTYYGKNTSEYLSALTNDLNLLEENWMKPMLAICENVGMFITTVGLLMYYSPWITLTIFITSAIAFLVPSVLGKYLSKRQNLLSAELAVFINHVKNVLSGYDVILSFNMFPQIQRNFKTYNEQVSKRKYDSDHFKVLNDTIGQSLGITIQIVTSCLSAYLVLKGEISIGALAAILQLCSRFVTPLMSIMNSMSLMKSMKGIVSKLEELSKTTMHSKGKTPKFEEGIEFRQVSFAYDTHPVLQQVSFRILPKKKYAIMGESGCGKSTLVKLMLGYYSTYTGGIRYDGDRLCELDSFQLNKMISMIQQNVYMFDDTIAYNICLQESYPPEKVNQVLMASGVDKFLSKEISLDSKVGENGCNLSGGQRQRIAIARALIRETPILVLDEGTSAIDMQSAYEIEANLLNIKELTLLSILHKTSEGLLAKYDEIIYMKHGNVIEQGSFHELMERKGEFYEFYHVGS